MYYIVCNGEIIDKVETMEQVIKILENDITGELYYYPVDAFIRRI